MSKKRSLKAIGKIVTDAKNKLPFMFQKETQKGDVLVLDGVICNTILWFKRESDNKKFTCFWFERLPYENIINIGDRVIIKNNPPWCAL